MMQFLIIVFVWAFLAGVLKFFMRLGCFCKEVTAYSGKEDLKFVHTAESKLARVNIVDSYTKNGVKYLSFTTSVSGERTFLMSEDEYDKHFGKGNDAVDCTIWSLTERNVIYREKYYFYSGIKTKDVKAAIYKLCEPGDMEFRTPYNHLREIKVMVGNGVKFDDGDYDIQAHFGVPWVDDMMSWKYFCSVANDFSKQRYSFLGESDFTTEEIEENKKAIDKVESDIVDICRGLTCGRRRRKKNEQTEEN